MQKCGKGGTGGFQEQRKKRRWGDEDAEGSARESRARKTKYLSRWKHGAFKRSEYNAAKVVTRKELAKETEKWGDGRANGRGWTHTAFLESSLSGRAAAVVVTGAVATKYPKKNTFPSPNR